MQRPEMRQWRTDIAHLHRMRARVITHLQVLEEHLLAHEDIDIVLGRKVAVVLLTLIDRSAELDSYGRNLVRAAVDYFILRKDNDDDLTSPVGLHDDATMLNGICDELGRPELRIAL